MAVLCLIAGMMWGLHMAISQDHSAHPAHAHLNLLGWVSLFLFGLYYRLHPALEHDKRAHVQVWSWLVGTVVMAIGVGLVHTGTMAGEPLAAIGSLIVFASILLFAWLLFRSERARAAMAPAE
jgi:drug/metabolite transporter (DMT)-like permease